MYNIYPHDINYEKQKVLYEYMEVGVLMRRNPEFDHVNKVSNEFKMNTNRLFGENAESGFYNRERDKFLKIPFLLNSGDLEKENSVQEKVKKIRK